MPLLMSSVQAGKQSHFQTETPLPTSGLDLTLLPHSSRLDDNGFGPRRTCAVVGGSGSLLAARHGAFIDAHQHVLRINRVRTRGFESHVGVRTTLNLFWGHPAHLEQWQAQQRVLSAAERARGLVVAVKAKDVLFFFEATANLSRTGVAPPAPLLLMSDRVYGKAVEHLCRATDNGRQWATDCPIMRPSSGLLAVVFALQALAWRWGVGVCATPCSPPGYAQPYVAISPFVAARRLAVTSRCLALRPEASARLSTTSTRRPNHAPVPCLKSTTIRFIGSSASTPSTVAGHGRVGRGGARFSCFLDDDALLVVRPGFPVLVPVLQYSHARSASTSWAEPPGLLCSREGGVAPFKEPMIEYHAAKPRK